MNNFCTKASKSYWMQMDLTNTIAMVPNSTVNGWIRAYYGLVGSNGLGSQQHHSASPSDCTIRSGSCAVMRRAPTPAYTCAAAPRPPFVVDDDSTATAGFGRGLRPDRSPLQRPCRICDLRIGNPLQMGRICPRT